MLVYALDRGGYRLAWSCVLDPHETADGARIPPFDSIEIDLAYLFGETE